MKRDVVETFDASLSLYLCEVWHNLQLNLYLQLYFGASVCFCLSQSDFHLSSLPSLVQLSWTLPLSIQTHSLFYSLPVFPIFHQPFFLPHVHVFSLILSIHLRSSIFPPPLQCPGTSIFTSLSPSLACLVIEPPSPLFLALSVKLFSSPWNYSPLFLPCSLLQKAIIPDLSRISRKLDYMTVICLYIFKPQHLLIFFFKWPF